MTVDTRHTLYDVQLGEAVPVQLPGITSAGVRTDTEHSTETTSGAIYPEHQAIVSQNPVADFVSTALVDCLTKIALLGLDISTLPTGLSIFAYKHANAGGRAGAAAHRKFLFNEGIVIPMSISADHQANAQIAYSVLPTWDETNAPFVESDGISVPTAAADAAKFAMGPVKINGTLYKQKKTVEMNFGQSAERESADSDLWATHVSLEEVKPLLSVRGIDVGWLKAANIPITGRLGTHANTSVYFRKRLAAAASPPGFHPDGSAVHVKITIDGMAFIDDAFTASATGASETSLQMPARYDGTNAPVVITVNTAIT